MNESFTVIYCDDASTVWTKTFTRKEITRFVTENLIGYTFLPNLPEDLDGMTDLQAVIIRGDIICPKVTVEIPLDQPQY